MSRMSEVALMMEELSYRLTDAWEIDIRDWVYRFGGFSISIEPAIDWGGHLSYSCRRPDKPGLFLSKDPDTVAKWADNLGLPVVKEYRSA